MLSVDDERKRIAEQEAQDHTSAPETSSFKRRKRNAAANMGKELTAEQKAIVKMYVERGVAEGVVKCCYCDKEITSRNVDRWASHLRGCVKTPDDIKAQIQPSRGVAASPASGRSAVKTDVAPAIAAPEAPVAVPAPVTHVPTVNPMGNGYNEVFKVHVSKDYMKFNAAHFIAYKVRNLMEALGSCVALKACVYYRDSGRNCMDTTTVWLSRSPDRSAPMATWLTLARSRRFRGSFARS
ncbi:unnamed protein product [Phytophthora lilii]|uniref:Unnamed protein product n=1 Tax=Phytophthora lilii TaxID=2077276 RepID=A0A9W6TU28_9STRA|nr:unnamed protein product [Phytophthora lilii]